MQELVEEATGNSTGKRFDCAPRALISDRATPVCTAQDDSLDLAQFLQIMARISEMDEQLKKEMQVQVCRPLANVIRLVVADGLCRGFPGLHSRFRVLYNGRRMCSL